MAWRTRRVFASVGIATLSVAVVCLLCARPGPSPCGACRLDEAPAPERVLPDGTTVRAAFAHRGAPRRAVHALKYHGVVAVVPYLVTAMAPLVPTGAEVLVPVPRVAWRRVRYGVDAAGELAAALGRELGLPVVRALVAPPWWPRHAGRSRSSRAPVVLLGRRRVSRAVLVDDVVTTGATLVAARSALRGPVVGSVTATTAGRVRGGIVPSTGR